MQEQHASLSKWREQDLFDSCASMRCAVRLAGCGHLYYFIIILLFLVGGQRVSVLCIARDLSFDSVEGQGYCAVCYYTQ